MNKSKFILSIVFFFFFISFATPTFASNYDFIWGHSRGFGEGESVLIHDDYVLFEYSDDDITLFNKTTGEDITTLIVKGVYTTADELLKNGNGLYITRSNGIHTPTQENPSQALERQDFDCLIETYNETKCREWRTNFTLSLQSSETGNQTQVLDYTFGIDDSLYAIVGFENNPYESGDETADLVRINKTTGEAIWVENYSSSVDLGFKASILPEQGALVPSSTGVGYTRIDGDGEPIWSLDSCNLTNSYDYSGYVTEKYTYTICNGTLQKRHTSDGSLYYGDYSEGDMWDAGECLQPYTYLSNNCDSDGLKIHKVKKGEGDKQSIYVSKGEIETLSGHASYLIPDSSCYDYSSGVCLQRSPWSIGESSYILGLDYTEKGYLSIGKHHFGTSSSGADVLRNYQTVGEFYNESPKDGSIGVDRNTNVSVSVNLFENDWYYLSLINENNNDVLITKNVTNGSRVSANMGELEAETEYEWTARLYKNDFSVEETYSFTTNDEKPFTTSLGNLLSQIPYIGFLFSPSLLFFTLLAGTALAGLGLSAVADGRTGVLAMIFLFILWGGIGWLVGWIVIIAIIILLWVFFKL